jgi:hypothetical protein
VQLHEFSFFAKPLHMKKLIACILLTACLQTTVTPTKRPSVSPGISPVQNLFIITIDGFRWQEIFSGADSGLINDEKFTTDSSTMKMMYWARTPEERRERLMPFFWNVFAKKGQIYGNRNFNNKVNVSNFYSISYPGYSEIFSGNTDFTIATNMKRKNPNTNVLEYLNRKKDFKDKVVVFTSWNVFPFILNKERSDIKINSGYEDFDTGTGDSSEESLVNKVQDGVYHKRATRHDELTFVGAKEYIDKYKPRVLFLGFGETDEEAHHGRYDMYLERATQIDKMIEELWHYVQSTPEYKGNTTFLLTTDHGRGNSPSRWSDHAFFINGSSQTWLAIMGPHITPLGEMKNEEQIYQKQVAQTIANLVGENFVSGKPVANAILLR